MKRRTFLKITARAAAVAGVVGADPRRASASPPVPIVDTHQHLWDLNVLNLPWVRSSTTLNRSFLPADYQRATAGLNVVRAVYMEVAAPPEQQQREAEYIVALCARSNTPTCAAVIGGQPTAAGFRAYITRFAGSPFVKGVRHGFSGVTDALVRGVRLLGELGMCFDICVPASRLGEGVQLVERCPDTRFVVDHCGNADPTAFVVPAGANPAHDPDRWRRHMAALAGHKNVVCKISGIVARAPKDTWTAADLAPIVNHCLEVFGPDRVLFGSDWPVCTRVARYREWVVALREIVAGRNAEFQRKLFHDNAVRFYGLA
jgi:predicted TIM-barrel fold metal-dependent hydrolase